MKTMVIAKKWGNSLGVILPADFVKQGNIQEGEELDITLEKKHNILKELFGTFKFNNTSTEEILKKSRKGMESKWMR